MHIAVTGGAGFIGSNLVDRLIAQGHRVTVLDNLKGGQRAFFAHHLSSKRFAFHKVELRNTKRLVAALNPNTELVYHLAANSDISRGIEEPALDFHNGIEASFSVLEAMRERGIRKLVYTSGSGVYGDCGTSYCDERRGPLEPVSMYGASKLGAEGLVSAFVHMFDFQAWVFRPANIIGPRATHGVVYDFFLRLRDGQRELRILGDGLQSKAYLHVHDVLDAFELAVSQGKKPLNVYNLSTSSFVTVNQIADIVIRELGGKPSSVKYRHTGGRVGWKGDVPVIRLRSTAIKRLGWQPRYDSRAAVKATVAALHADKRFAR